MPPPADLATLAAAIFTRYLIVCSRCRAIGEYDEADELDRAKAAEWFRGKGWRVISKKVVCARCVKGQAKKK
jgi:hypothetical protein